jgi:hypothetical protein
MHPRLAELDDLLTRERAALLAAVALVPPADRDRSLAPGRWTVGQLLEHLRLVEAGSARLLERRLERAREAGLPEETETASILERFDGATHVEGPPRVAPDVVAPQAVSTEEALAGLAESRDALRAVMHQGDGLALEQVRARHEVLGDISMYEWLAFLAHHERRHAQQLRALAPAE